MFGVLNDLFDLVERWLHCELRHHISRRVDISAVWEESNVDRHCAMEEDLLRNGSLSIDEDKGADGLQHESRVVVIGMASCKLRRRKRQ